MDSNFQTLQYNKLKSLLQFAYPFQYSLITYRSLLEEAWRDFELEVFSNLATLESTAHDGYLNFIRKGIEHNLADIQVSPQELYTWSNAYHRYREDISEEDMKTLAVVLDDVHPSQFDASPDYLHRERIIPRQDTLPYRFYNYCFAYYATSVLRFVDEQLHKSLSSLPANSATSDTSQFKVKTNLTVPELTYLFRALADAEIIIFEGREKSQLFNFISRNFTSKNKGGDGGDISPNTIRDFFYGPPEKAVKKCSSLFTLMKSKASDELTGKNKPIKH